MRPDRSISASWAGAIMRRWMSLAFSWKREVEPTRFSEKVFHSSGGKSQRHRSTPRVRTTTAPAISERIRAGISSLPFSSSVQRNSPVIIPPLDMDV